MTEMANVRKITGSRTKQPTTFWPKHEHNNKTKSQPRAHTFYRKKINGTREKKKTTEETTMKIPSSKAPAFVRNFLSFCNEFIWYNIFRTVWKVFVAEIVWQGCALRLLYYILFPESVRCSPVDAMLLPLLLFTSFFFHSSIFSFYFTLFNSSCTLPCIQFGITWAKPLTQILASQFNPFRVFVSQFSLRCLAFELFFYPRLCSRCVFFFFSYFLLCLKSCSISASLCLSQSLLSSICFSLLLSQISLFFFFFHLAMAFFGFIFCS